MALDPNINTLEKGKFREDFSGQPAVAVVSSGDPGGLLSGTMYDDIQVTYPDLVTETYTYFLNSAQVAEIEVTYTSSSKKILERARRV
jgi:hypothetical protein